MAADPRFDAHIERGADFARPMLTHLRADTGAKRLAPALEWMVDRESRRCKHEQR